jgi:hypothetical protein
MRKILLMMAAAVLAGCTTQSPTVEEKKAAVEEAPVPAYYESEREAQPFPSILPATMVGDPKAVRVYEIAARIPGVLTQQPCYCNCDRGHGHKGLLDCHRDAHSAT